MNPRLEALHAYPFERLARPFARELHARAQVMVLAGGYLGRAHERGNPGAGRVRTSLVPPLRQCVEAAERIRDFLRAPRAAVRNSRA
jgi:aspartate/methionine/tyrosine aminotransferase